MRNSYNVDVLNSVDIQGIVKFGWKVIEIYEGVKRVKIQNVSNPNLLESKLIELNKIETNEENLHEIKKEILRDYEGDFEMIGSLKVDDEIRQTHINFWNIVDCEHCINAIGEGYGSEDAIFKG